MFISVIGGSYTGIVSAVCFCEFGFKVALVEIDPSKLDILKNDKYSLFEPGLSPLFKKHIKEGNIVFSDDIATNVEKSDAVVITVPTTKQIQNADDSNLSDFHRCLEYVAVSLSKDHYTGVFIKTSLPVGTCSVVANNFRFMRSDLIPGEHYDVISNPGFLREGSAIHDFMMPNRVLIGLERDSKKAKEIIGKVYESIISLKTPFVYSNYETVELIRSATIAFIVTKMAFANEMAELCDKTGADIDALIRGIALDKRVGYKALEVSPGIGGTSYPRAARILKNSAELLGLDLEIVSSALKSNEHHISRIKDKILKLLEYMPQNEEKRVSIFGLSFKPQTSDIRESASVTVIDCLLNSGCEVYAYDPLYKSNSLEIKKIPEQIRNNPHFHLTDSPYEASSQSDLIAIMTNWNEFMSLDFEKIHDLMNKQHKKKPIILDYRNMFKKEDLPQFEYIAHGRRKDYF